MQNNIVFVIVIYNKLIDDSITIKTIKNIGLEINMIIVDNSDEQNQSIRRLNGEKCLAKKVQYINMGGNKGLSKAYNSAIELCDGYDAIVLMDDDTEISKEYICELDRCLSIDKDIDIFAPIVYGQDGVIYSPNEFNFLRNKFMKDEFDFPSMDKFNAIASCLAIRPCVFNDYRFNESLFVDQVDQNFFCDQRKRNVRFGIIPVTIRQNFYQRGSDLTSKKGWNRLKLRVADIVRHARLLGGGFMFLAIVKSVGLGVQIGLKTKTPIIPIKTIYVLIKSILKK